MRKKQKTKLFVESIKLVKIILIIFAIIFCAKQINYGSISYVHQTAQGIETTDIFVDFNRP